MIAFYLKKIVAFFIQPFGMILTLFIVGLFFLFFKKDKVSKIFLSLSFFFLVLLSYQPFANSLILPLESKYQKYKYNKEIKYIHVLGAGFNTVAAYRRVVEGVNIYKQSLNSKMIITGHGISVIANSELAIALGVKKENIIMSMTQKDTKDEAIYAKSILSKNDKFVLVTSATHIPRAMFLFQSVGLNPIAAPTDFRGYRIESGLRMVNVGALEISQMAIHEYIGLLWSRLST